MKTEVAHTLLLSTINSISFSGPEDLENARHVKWFTTRGKIPADEINKVISAIDQKLWEVSDSGNNTYVAPICSELATARAGAQEQLRMYQTLLNSDSTDTQAADIDPAIVASRMLNANGRRPNGHDVATE